MKDNLDEILSNIISNDIEPSTKLVEITKLKVKSIKEKDKRIEKGLLLFISIISTILFLIQFYIIFQRINLDIISICVILGVYLSSFSSLSVIIFYYRKEFINFIK